MSRRECWREEALCSGVATVCMCSCMCKYLSSTESSLAPGDWYGVYLWRNPIVFRFFFFHFFSFLLECLKYKILTLQGRILGREMTSLDDTIISRGNLLLLDNVTNYGRAAIDYFSHEFRDQDIATTWKLLLKMRNHKLLRLPSCSLEDDLDYHLYLSRLYHTIWRRWSQQLHGLDGKANPLSINWDKELDITVLYGPELTVSEGVFSDEEKEISESSCSDEVNLDGMGADWEEDDASIYSSSGDSSVSSIFDQAPKSLRFSETVLRRDIDQTGLCYESHIMIKRPPMTHGEHCNSTWDWV